MKKLFLILNLICFSFTLFAREFSLNDAEKLVQGSEKIIVDDQTGSIKYVKLKKDKKISVVDNLTWLNTVLNVSNAENFKLYKTETDQLGFTHYCYQQMIHGITVEDGVFYIHTKDGYIVSANGEYYPNIQIKSKSPSISTLRAIEIAKKSVKGNTGKWNDKITLKPTKVIVFDGNGGYNLAYKTDVYSQNPLTRKFVYVDANTGNIIKEKNRIHEADVVGSAVTKYNGTKPITADSYGGSYRLRETGRGNGINTYDLNTSTDYAVAVDFTDADNYWNTTTNQDNAAYDAHFGSEATYDYYLNSFGRNSYDNSGAQMNSYVHFSSGFVNAFWDGTQMTYGDGDGTNYSALTSIDVVGHEITHAVTENTANLVYSYESGALNESFSDIFGIVIDFYKNPGTANYIMGEQFAMTGIPFRSMSNPNMYGDPDTYNGTNWYTGSSDNGGVHTNSGVQNYWFYLLTNGGAGTNDIGNAFSVTGIGITSAAAIAYRSLSTYLTANSQYADARFYAIQSAIDLYGSCSSEEIATTNAWHAVGVGGVYSNAVISAFNANITYSCTSPTTIIFTNNSINGSSYLWDFGDGGTSTLANPTHTYTSTGTYSVSLITTGSASCGSVDTLIQPNFITVTNSGGPISASCSPSTTGASTYAMGIFNFTFASINKSSNGGTDGYQDYTCSNSATVTEGVLYTINITTGSSYNEDARIWIDLNNDGQFNMTNELVFISDNKLINHTGTIIVPSGAVTNTPLRMRVASDLYSNNFTNSCTNVTYGQYEDYSVTILPNTNPPNVDFIANNTTVNINQVVNFTDLTQNIPTSWNWTFTGATSTSSTQQNPSVTYSSVGVYPVTLVATNSFGTDSLTKTAYINVVNTFNMCSATNNTTATSGVLFDSGGPTGSYSNNENCSFLINPGCATNITLNFNSFYLESCCDYFRVYDGINSSGTLLMSANGSSLPSSVNAASGSMYITFTSDGSVTYSGWQATWSSTVPASTPVANFIISNNNPPLNVVTQFTDATTNLPNSWLWNFGDGNSSVLQNPSHAYTSSGTYTVSLISNNCYDADTVSYNITVQEAPIINITPNPVTANVACGGSISIPLNIFNTGTGDLVYDIEGTGNIDGGTIELLALTYGVDMTTEYPNTKSAINQYYTNYNLTELNTTSASVLQATLVGKNVLLIPEQENGSPSVFTGFATVLQNFVNNGGSVIFCGSGSSYEAAIFNTGLFSGTIGGVISTGTLNLVNAGHMLAASITAPVNAASATFYYNITNTDVTNILEYNGNSVVTYREIGVGKAILVGFDYYATNNNLSRFIANAIEFAGQGSIANWLTLSQNTDTVIPSDTSIITLTLDASNLYAGTYYDTLTVNSNDLSNSPLLVPISFTVTGQPLINITPTNINFGSIQVGATITDTLYIDNNGCDTLDISSFLSSNASFTVNSSGFQIPPYSSDTVLITFSPDTIKTYADTIFINNNDTLTYVLVNGIGVGAPIISYIPTSIVDTIFGCNDSLTIPVTVYNTGQGSLYTSVNINSVTSGGASNFFDGFEDGTYNNWTAVGTASNFQIINTNPATGSKCLKILGSSSNTLDHNFTPDTIHYVSVKLKSDDISGPNNYFMLGNATYNYGVCYIAHNNTNQYVIVSNSTYTYTVLGSNVWTHFELKNINYTTKTFDLYINGTLIQTGKGFYSTGTANISKVKLYNYDATYGAYYDDIQIGAAVVPQWITSSTDTLNVNIADSSTFNVTLYSEGLNSGTYNTNIILSSNDPVSPFDTIPVSFTVDGSPQIALSDNCLNFGSIMENTSANDSLTIYNYGCDTLFITNITEGITEYSANTTSMVILSGDSGVVKVTFSPTTMGTFNSYLTIYNNDIDTTICLTGAAYGAPITTYNPTSISETIYSCNDSITIPVTVYNTGQGPLYTSVNIGDVSSGSASNFFDGFENGTYNNWTANGTSSNFQVINTNPATGSKCLKILGSSTNTLEHDFTPDTIHYVSVKLKSDDISSYNNYFMLGNASYNYGICYITHYSTNQYYIVGNSTYVYTISGTNAWTNFELKNINYTTKTFDLYINGTLIQASKGFYSSSMTSISKVKLYNYDATYAAYYDDIQIGAAVVPQWITSSTDTLNVNIADSSTFNVTLYSEGLNSGTYNTNIILSSNDPVSPFDTIPVSFTVDGSPQIALSDNCLNFGSIMENTSANDSLTIYNYGCDTLFITNITEGITEYSANTTSMVILPGDSGVVKVTFSPTSTGNYNSYLTIYNNDTDTTVCLTGSATSAPIISVNPISFNVNLSACQDSITLPLTIYNTGGSNLELNINGSGSGGGTIEVLAVTYGSDLSTEYPNTISAINQYFTNYNLTQSTTTSASTLQSELVGKNVCLIPENESGTGTIFSGFATVLQNFVTSGGTVIFCGSTDTYADAIFNTSLLSGSYAGYLTSGTLNLVNSTHELANLVTTPVYAANATRYYNITNSDAVNIIEYSGKPIVTYRNVGAGKVILVGYDYFAYDNNAARFIANAIEWGGAGSLASWITLSQTTDTIIPSNSSIIYVTFYSGGLNGGTYNADITINSNDPITPQLIVPCTINVLFDPCADFTYDIPNTCSGQVNFTDQTLNNPTSWFWTFGDGNTSTLQNPSHLYSSSGNYNVQLIACNATSCDTALYMVNVSSTNGPIAASCSPITTGASSYGMGIYNVTFSTINNTTSLGGVDSYKDYTCTSNTMVTGGNTYSINITTGSGYNEDVSVWIDFNNDGQFNMTNERVFVSENIMQNHSGNVAIPTGALLNTPLRMRVMSDYGGNTISTACTNVMYGQCEDYSVLIQSNMQPPNSNYTYNILDQCQGVVKFTDVSTNFPTSWLWTFGDGTSSTYQNPFHTFTIAGYYAVQLIASNAYGSDTTQQLLLINSLNASFTYVLAAINQPTQFNSTSVGAISWSWNFGDGYSASLANPLHVYTDTGCYSVTLSVINGASCNSSVTNQVCISNSVGINEIYLSDISIHPNPSSGKFTINSIQNQLIEKVVVLDKLGKLVYSDDAIDKETYQFDISDNAKGIYFVRISTDTENIVRKVILQ